MDSDDILRDPAGTLAALCQAIGISWDPAMLSWRSGPHPEDGIWGAHWYDKVNASTGFSAPPGELPKLEGAYREVAEECREDYQALKRHALAPK